MIRSQSRIVVSRCAMIRQVQPRRRRLSSTIISVFGSSALVASSRIKRLGLRTSARAICSRWRWPPEKFRPCSLTAALYPPRRLKQVAVDRGVDPCLDEPVRWNHLVPKSQVLANRALEQTDIGVDQLDGVDEDFARQLV